MSGLPDVADAYSWRDIGGGYVCLTYRGMELRESQVQRHDVAGLVRVIEAHGAAPKTASSSDEVTWHRVLRKGDIVWDTCLVCGACVCYDAEGYGVDSKAVHEEWHRRRGV